MYSTWDSDILILGISVLVSTAAAPAISRMLVDEVNILVSQRLDCSELRVAWGCERNSNKVLALGGFALRRVGDLPIRSGSCKFLLAVTISAYQRYTHYSPP